MALDMVNFEQRAQKAVMAFWKNRNAAKEKQLTSGKTDQGERAGVTGGKNMDGFMDLVLEVIKSNGLENAQIHQNKRVLTLPGYFRPTKLWDVLVIYKKQLIASIELKSQVGPSFGNNFNNRTEEAIGTAHDFWTAYREGAYGDQPRPFVGWLILVEDSVKSNSPVKDRSEHFPVDKEFEGASYLHRYDILCRRLMKEQLYSGATLIASAKSSSKDGTYREFSSMTGLKTFVSGLAGHIAAEAARLG
jgi:hypothetical protein